MAWVTSDQTPSWPPRGACPATRAGVSRTGRRGCPYPALACAGRRHEPRPRTANTVRQHTLQHDGTDTRIEKLFGTPLIPRGGQMPERYLSRAPRRNQPLRTLPGSVWAHFSPKSNPVYALEHKRLAAMESRRTGTTTRARPISLDGPTASPRGPGPLFAATR